MWIHSVIALQVVDYCDLLPVTSHFSNNLVLAKPRVSSSVLANLLLSILLKNQPLGWLQIHWLCSIVPWYTIIRYCSNTELMTSCSSLWLLALWCGCATCGLSVVLSSIYLIIWFLFLVPFYLVCFRHHNEGCDKIISCVLPGFCWLLGDK